MAFTKYLQLNPRQMTPILYCTYFATINVIRKFILSHIIHLYVCIILGDMWTFFFCYKHLFLSLYNSFHLSKQFIKNY